MSDAKKPTKVATGAKVTPRVGKPAGKIVYNKYINSWQCINAKGDMVLSIGDLESAKKMYPDFVVKG